jgi:hypothetical protein
VSTGAGLLVTGLITVVKYFFPCGVFARTPLPAKKFCHSKTLQQADVTAGPLLYPALCRVSPVRAKYFERVIWWIHGYEEFDIRIANIQYPLITHNPSLITNIKLFSAIP